MKEAEVGFHYWVRPKWQQYGQEQVGRWEVMLRYQGCWMGIGNEVEYGDGEIAEVGPRINPPVIPDGNKGTPRRD